MMTTTKILAFSGSAREASWNKKLCRVAAQGAEKAGAVVTVIDLKNFDLPIYNGDFEDTHGVPENAQKLHRLFSDHQGLLISSPENNGSFSSLLKNTFDWISRVESDESPFINKVAVIMSASPGALGGLRGLAQLRTLLGNIGFIVLPKQNAVSKAHEAFEADGRLKDAKLQTTIEGLGAEVVCVTTALNKQ